MMKMRNFDRNLIQGLMTQFNLWKIEHKRTKQRPDLKSNVINHPLRYVTLYWTNVLEQVKQTLTLLHRKGDIIRSTIRQRIEK